MSRSNQIVTQFPALDHEPRGHGPPPSYRNSAATEDSWSTMSGSNQAMGQRRSSWNNLVQVGGDPMAPKQAPPRPAPPVSTTFSAGSRTSSLMGIPPGTVFSTQFSEVETAHARVHTVRYIDETAEDSGRSTSRDTVTEAQGHAMPMQKVFSNDPRLVSAPRPAGTIQSSGSISGSRAQSIILAPNPSPPLTMKNLDSRSKKNKGKDQQPKRNRLQDIKQFVTSPKTIGCCLCLLMALIVAVIVIIILAEVLPSPKQATFTWIAPPSLTNGQNVSSKIEMKAEKERVRFQMTGAAPMKGNFINYYDFNNNQVVVVDQSLNANGKNLYCFIVPLDRSAMPNSGQVRKAAKNSVLRHQQETGWQETWTWIPSPLQQTDQTQNMFNPPIPECNGSRIVQLQSTSDQRNRRCTDCYDFCLPQYGIAKDPAKNNEEYLNVVQRDCFYLFVPEWRTYAQANTIEQNQQDFENYYRNRQHMQVSYGSNGPNDSRWIPLSGMPRQMMNATGAFVGQVGNAIGNLRNNVYGAITGQQPQQQMQQHQNMQQQQHYGNGNSNGNGNGNTPYGQVQNGYQNGNGNGQMPNQMGQQQMGQQQQQQSMQPSGYHPAVNGVVNLNGVNGNNGNTEYNVQPIQQQGQGQQQSIGPEMRRQAPYTYRANVNSGYTNQQPQVSSGSTNMNGFGAQPGYQTAQYGFANNGLSNNVNGQHNSAVSSHTVAPSRIGVLLNEFGNPVNIHPSQQSTMQQQGVQSQMTQMNQMNQMNTGLNQVNPNPQIMPMTQDNPNYVATSGGLAATDNGQFTQRLQQLMGSSSNYRPDVEPVNYNVPVYNQPNRPDALSRQGRIFK